MITKQGKRIRLCRVGLSVIFPRIINKIQVIPKKIKKIPLFLSVYLETIENE